MRQIVFCSLIGFAIAGSLPGRGYGQTQQAHTTVAMPISTASTDASGSLSPLQAPATVEQIREYLRLSGDMDAFRLSWIAALDKNRSIGAPYWPEEFWTALKAEMQKTDLMPLYVTLYQHGISKALMDEVLDAYHTLGSEHFKGSPACFKLGDAFLRMADDMDKLKLAKTQEVAIKIYDIYKPQIKAARVQYIAEHPDWKDPR